MERVRYRISRSPVGGGFRRDPIVGHRPQMCKMGAGRRLAPWGPVRTRVSSCVGARALERRADHATRTPAASSDKLVAFPQHPYMFGPRRHTFEEPHVSPSRMFQSARLRRPGLRHARVGSDLAGRDPGRADIAGIDVAGMDRAVDAGRRLLRLRQRHLAARPPRSRADRGSYGAGAILTELTDQRTARADPGGGAGKRRRRLRRAQDRRLLRELHGRGRASRPRGSRRCSPSSTRSPRSATRKDLARVLGATLRADVDALNATNFYTDNLFGLWVAQDLDDPTRYVAVPAAGRPRHARPRLLPRRHRRAWRRSAPSTRPTSPRCSKLAGVAGRRGQGRARSFDLETPDRAGARDAARTRTTSRRPTTTGRAPTSTPKAPGLDWDAFFAAAGLAEPAATSSSGSRAPSPASPRSSASEPLDDLEGLPGLPRDRAPRAPCCPRPSCDERFAFYGKALSGHAEAARALEARASTPPTPRSARRSASSTSTRYFPPAAKARAQEMVREHHRRVRPPHRRARLDGAGDQGEGQGQARACSRSASAIPTTGATTPASRSSAGDAFGNAERAELFEYRRNLAKLGTAGGPRASG